MAVNLDTFESTSVGLDQENFGKIPDSQLLNDLLLNKFQKNLKKSLKVVKKLHWKVYP